MYAINGYQLHSPADGRWVIQPTDTTTPQTPWESDEVRIPGMHGSLLGRPAVGTPEFKVHMLVNAGAPLRVVESLIPIIDGVITRFNGTQQARVTIRNVERKTVQYESGAVKIVRLTITYAMTQGFWRDVNATETDVNGGGTFGSGATAPLVDALISFENPNNAALFAVAGTSFIRVTGSHSGFVLVDTSTQQAWLTPGRQWSAGGTNISDYLQSGDGPYALQVTPTTNGITSYYSVSGGGSATSAVIRFRRAYSE